MSMNIPAAIKEVAELLSKVPAGVIPHVLDFARALVDGDEEKAKRAATSAVTQRLFNAPVRKAPPLPPKRKP
jgi:hypothetical protein